MTKYYSIDNPLIIHFIAEKILKTPDKDVPIEVIDNIIERLRRLEKQKIFTN